MVDAIIIIICVIAAVNVGLDSLQLLPEDIIKEVSNYEALRFTIAGFAAIIVSVSALSYRLPTVV